MSLEAPFTQYPYCFQEDSKVKMVAMDLEDKEELEGKAEQVNFHMTLY